jgi:hypothetical protein
MLKELTPVINEKKELIRLPYWWPYLLAGLIALLAKLPVLNNNILFIDEPGYLSHARRLDSFEAFVFSFQYHTETKFPLGLLPYILAQAINQPQAILLTRIFGVSAFIISALLLVKLSKKMFDGATLPAFFALIAWCLFLNQGEQPAVPLLEYYQTPLLLFSFLLCLFAFHKWEKSGKYFTGVGVCLSFTALIKPTIVVLAPSLGLILLGVVYWKDYRTQSWWKIIKARQLWGFGLGFLVPVLVFVLPYFFRTEALIELKFNLFEVTSSYANYNKESLLIRSVLLLGTFGPALLLLFFIAFFGFLIDLFIRIKSKLPLQVSYQLFLLLFGWALFAGATPGQAKAYYLVPAIPFLMLFVGYRLYHVYVKLTLPSLRLGWIALILMGMFLIEWDSIVFYSTLLSKNETFYTQQMPDVDIAALTNYIKANSDSKDYIWVYYNAPELYWLADRKPATNEPPATWLIDFYSPFWFDRVTTQLKRDNPKLIIGINKPRFPRDKIALLTELPVISSWLQQAYQCDNTKLSNITICTRI